MTIGARDNSLPFNPFLQRVAPSAAGPVYWSTAGMLRWHLSSGRSASVELTAADVARWFARHDPADLWTQWERLLINRRFLIEHTSVNPVHPLHAGSLRGTILGASLAGLLRSAGADVEVRYFINDCGHQVNLLRQVANRIDWRVIPSHLRRDEAAGVLYALANMMQAHRHADIARLTRAHPWLVSIINTIQHATCPTTSGNPHLVEEIVALAAADMGVLSADIDVYDYESDLPADLRALVLNLVHGHEVTTINGTLCLRRPAGLVPLQRQDGKSLYFTRDLANTYRRIGTGRTIMHVIGDDQTLLQRALRDVVPTGEIEHIAVAVVTQGGKKFSARQNRLLTVADTLATTGTTGVWALALAMLLRRRTHPIDLAYLDQIRPLRTVVTAHALARQGKGISGDQAQGSPAWWNLVQAFGRAPGVLDRALIGRAPHASAALLVELSARYLAAARHQRLPGWVQDWFLSTQSRLAALHGLHLGTLADATGPDPHRRTA